MSAKAIAASKSKANESSRQPTRALGGLVVRRECWRLSLRGWVALFVVAAAIVAGAVLGVYPFLAVTAAEPPGQYLIVEGWIPAEVLKESFDEFHARGYQKIIVSGSIVYDEWSNGKTTTWADWGASKLRRLGVPPNLIQGVPCYVEKKDRTYSSAMSVKEWLAQHGGVPKEINVFTQGTHARRSRLLYEKAFGSDVKVGIICAPDPQFDPSRWWRTSEGVREVVGEGIAYIYARFFFRPA